MYVYALTSSTIIMYSAANIMTGSKFRDKRIPRSKGLSKDAFQSCLFLEFFMFAGFFFIPLCRAKCSFKQQNLQSVCSLLF